MRGAVATAPAWPDRLAGAAVALAAVVVYANSLAVPFVFDDIAAVHTNPTIRRLGTALAPPDGLSVTGRPLANVSLALSYALSGTAPRGYHLINIALHALAGAVLFGSVRRTLLKPPLRERFGGASRSLALVVALVWTVHPVQTAS